MLALHVENEILHLKRQLTRVTVGTPASVGEPLNAAFLVTIEDLVAGLAEIPNSLTVPPSVRRLAGEQQTAAFHPLPNTPSKASLPPL